MSPVAIAVIALRTAALALSFYDAKTADRLKTLADLIDAGSATDAHMAEVAAKLKAGALTDADWDDLYARLKSAQDDLQAPDPVP